MESGNSVEKTEQRTPQRLNRVLYSLIIASFFLPFATVRSCMGDESEGVSYTGIALLAEEAGVLLIGVLLLAGSLIAFSFRHRSFTAIQEGLLSASKALLSAIAILTTFFATGMTFMFSRVSLQVGFFLCVGSWFVLQIIYTLAAFRDRAAARKGCRGPPPPWGIVVSTLAAIVFVITAFVSEPDGLVELLLGVFAGLLITVPLVVLASLSAVWYRLHRQAAVAVEGDRTGRAQTQQKRSAQ